ncbi:MAG: TetR/AcrR family transcriptional regulator [Actinomycetia bacterium]|nr:TetR/AcrR family transcriptional regulator [Actinomycetes bacterium]
MSADTPSTPVEPAVTDGRSRRWERHRATRREELVDATMRAIRTHGASVGMDDVAAAAATSKTVFYRHFTDRAGLYAAVTERVAETILRDLTREGSASLDAPERAGIGAAIDAYLGLVEDEPEIYRFVVTAPLLERAGAGDPSASVSTRVAEHLAARLATWPGLDGQRARVCAHGVVGMVRAAADDWLGSGAADSGVTKEELSGLLTDLAWSGLS